METAEFLARERDAILDAAQRALGRAHGRHYEAADKREVRERLGSLFDETLRAVRERDLAGVIAHARRVAEERFAAGYDLGEVQTAFNALEEAMWSRVFADLEPRDFAEALGLIGTVLGAAKDALARRYVALATQAHTPALDMSALFAGAESPAE
jgi:hypothetical protein